MGLPWIDLLGYGCEVMPGPFVDDAQVAQARGIASEVIEPVFDLIRRHTTISVERTILRLFGMSDAGPGGVPLTNLMTDRLKAAGVLNRGRLEPIGHEVGQGDAARAGVGHAEEAQDGALHRDGGVPADEIEHPLDDLQGDAAGLGDLRVVDERSWHDLTPVAHPVDRGQPRVRVLPARQNQTQRVVPGLLPQAVATASAESRSRSPERVSRISTSSLKPLASSGPLRSARRPRRHLR